MSQTAKNDTESIKRNTDSFSEKSLPKGYITSEDRMEYIIRARNGEDVRVYGDPVIGYHILDTGTRIPLSKIAESIWTFVEFSSHNNFYTIWCHNLLTTENIVISLDIPNATPYNIHRIIKSFFGNINKLHDSPLKYNHCVFTGA